MTIRPFPDSDRERILELLRLNTPHYFAPNEEQDLRDYLDHHLEHYFVVEVSDVVYGCAGINLAHNGTRATLSWDIVHPDYHGKGLGSALIRHRLECIRAMPGIRSITVRTSQHVYPFYEKFGFRLVEVVKDYWAEGFDLYRMELNEKHYTPQEGLPETVVIREATISDIPHLQNVRHSVTENVLSNPALVRENDYVDHLTGRGKGWVSEVENQVVGFAIVDLRSHNIWALFLLPEFEGRGIGRKLHDAMLDWYFSQTRQTVWLSTSPGTRAEAFYRKSGWQEMGVYGDGEIRFEMRFEDWIRV